MFAVVLTVIVTFLMMSRSYRKCFQRLNIGDARMDSNVSTKPIPEENGEKICEVRLNMFLHTLNFIQETLPEYQKINYFMDCSNSFCFTESNKSHYFSIISARNSVAIIMSLIIQLRFFF